MDDVKKKNIIKALIILVFVVIAVYTALHHEHWGDEAQSFLIARDNSILEIFHYAKYEGTTPLWFLIIKCFLKLGGSYETFFILPIIFSVIGLIIFEYKVKAPWYIKVLYPFTYYILYQYSIVARSYCMVFPAFMFLASIYKDRKEKQISYFLALLFLMNICSYTWVIAFSLFCIDVLYMFKNKSFNEKTIKPLVFTFLFLSITFFMLIPYADCSFFPRSSKNVFYTIYQATIGNTEGNNYINVIVTTLLLLIFIKALRNEKNRFYIFLELAIIFTPVLMEIAIVAGQIWHIGIITFLLFTVFMLNDMINHNRIIQILAVIICIVQIVWSGFSINYDLNNKYSAAKDVADFLKEGNYKNINGYDFEIVAIQPYFTHNIFKNMNSSKSFWIWSYDENKYDRYLTSINDDVDVYVFAEYEDLIYDDTYNEVKKKEYKDYYFKGHMYTKMRLHDIKSFHVFVKEDK